MKKDRNPVKLPASGLVTALFASLALAAVSGGPLHAQEAAMTAVQGPEEAEATNSIEEDAPPPTHKAGFDRKPVFGGPNSPEGTLEEDDRIKLPAFRWGGFDGAMSPWFDWKKGVNESIGLQLTGHYVSLLQSVSETLGEEDQAASGVFRLTASWALVGRGSEDTGSFVVTYDHRHAYTEIPPGSLGGEAGYLGVTGTLFTDIGSAIVNLNWQQAFDGRRTGLMVGRFDPSDYMNILGYVNPWAGFQNVAVLLEPSVAFPDSSWGLGIARWFDDQWWALGTANDANGAITDDLEFFEEGAELFKQVSFGWSPSKEQRYTHALVSSIWHVDERIEAGIERAQGFTLSGNWTWDELFMLFARAGFSEGSAPLYNRSATLGFIRKFAYRSDLIGLGINWGDPPDDSLAEQVTVEAFYQLQVAQNLELTPSVQYLRDPAYNLETRELWLFGARLRFTF